MVILTIEQADTLEFQTQHCYEAFSRAVESHMPIDASLARNAFNNLEEALNLIEAGNYMRWRRGAPKSKVFNPYVLPLILGKVPSKQLKRIAAQHSIMIDPKPVKNGMTKDKLMKMIFKNASYTRIQEAAIKTAKAHEFYALVEIMGYVRENYRPLF